MDKGIVIEYLCINPSCSYSENKLVFKTTLNLSSTSAKFKILNCCPKCKSGIEMLSFISGSVEIKRDKLE